jgi:monoterpene epsilon-lactone hydrolase
MKKPSEEIKTVRALASALPKTGGTSCDELRAMTDQMAALFPLPEGTSVEEVDADGVGGEWVKASGAGDGTAVLYLHGGGYAVGSPASHRHLAAAVSEAAGAPVLSLDYRLAPEHPFPAAVQDAVAGYRWLLKQGIAPGRIAIAGDSAGGGLTVAALLSLRGEGDRLPALGLCISPWLDLTCTAASYESKAEIDPMINLEDVMWFASMYLGKTDPRTPLASPLFADLQGLPPLLIQVGSDEVLLDDSIRLDARAKEAGVDSTLEVWDDMVHVWHLFYPMLKEGRDALSRLGEYFKSGTSS